MKTVLFCIFTLFISVVGSNATIRRVGFTDIPPVAGIDYATCYAAHQAAANGDTILIFPGKTIASGWYEVLGDIQISKRLVFISKGFWLDSATNPRGNSALQANKGTGLSGANAGGIKFLAGSAGSTLMGFDLGGTTVRVSASNITIKRNFNLVVYLDNVSASGLVVTGNYRLSFGGNDNSVNVWNEVWISNNFIYSFNLPQKSYTGRIDNNTWAYDNKVSGNGGDSAISIVTNTGGVFPTQNNIELENGAWLFQNNLIVGNSLNNTNYGITNGTYTTFNNNVATTSGNFTSWPGIDSGNVFIPVASVSSIFEAFPLIGSSSADGRYRLKAASPALAGSPARPTAAIDAGMYGSTTPYKPGMIPSIPSIYHVTSPQGNNPTGNTLQVILSIRSNN